MGHQKRHRPTTKSYTLPSSPTHSSSSSDFEFTVPLSPRKSSADLRPADELFYKGKLLPLHLTPRLSMVRTLLLSSSSTSSSDTTTTASRASTSSSSGDCDSSRPSSAADDDTMHHPLNPHRKPPSKYFSLPKFSSVFRKTTAAPPPPPPSSGAATVKSIIRKYFNKVKPFYEKLSHKVSHPPPPTAPAAAAPPPLPSDDIHTSISHSFSGNLRCPRRTTCFSSCPSSIGSSPTHGRSGSGFRYGLVVSESGSGSGGFNSDASSMEELQNAIQGAILHCKNSMLQNRV
ncbi:hypothetical protein ACS0TY_022689 [Phlomoides rotata]